MDAGSNLSLAGSAGLRLLAVNDAVETFLAAATAACAVLEGLSFALPFVKGLQFQVIPLVEDFEVQIEECEENVDEAVKLLQELKDEATALGALLLFFEHIDDEIDKQIGQGASVAVKAEIALFITAKLRPVRETGRQLYDLLGDSIQSE
jgi:hypothetical protein